jgi:putative ATP-binding cassette transporter
MDTENSGQCSPHRSPRLWQKFITLAKPYWYPTGGSLLFLGLLGLLLLFLAALLGMLIVTVSGLGHHYFSASFDALAPGLWATLSQLGEPFRQALGLGLLIPAMVFGVINRRLRDHWLPWLLLAVLLLFSLSVSGLNVIISYVGRFFQSALAEKDAPTFWRFLWVYAGVFAELTLATMAHPAFYRSVFPEPGVLRYRCQSKH